MASTELAGVMRHLHQLVGPPENRERTDAQLLACFRERRDETAFRLLMERHGRMVLGVCRRVLHQQQDAEDAFQATFLVLAQRAASIREDAALTSWLYGVAYRIALKARIQMSKRQAHEKKAAKADHVGPDLNLAWQELQTVLAEEVGRLPEKYRAPFVLCCLESLSKSDAARRLGWKEGTVSGRLAEARKRLQQRLTRRGLTLTAALCAGAWTADAAAAVSRSLTRNTLNAAMRVAAGQTAAGVVSAPIAALMEGVTRTMFLGKTKLAAILLLASGLFAAGVGTQLHRAAATPAGEEKSAEASVGPASRARPSTPRAERRQPAARKPPTAKDAMQTVRGRVLGPDGKPLAGAQVFLPAAIWGDKKDKKNLFNGKCDAKGRFRFTVERSQLVEGRALIATVKGYAPDWIDAKKIGTKEIALRLVEDLPIEGRILDVQGQPIEEVTVSVQRIQASTEGNLDPVLKTIQRDGNNVFGYPLRMIFCTEDAGFPASVKTDAAGRFRITGVGRERIARVRVEAPTIEHQTLYVLTRPKINVQELVKSAPDRMGGLHGLPTMYGPTFEHVAGPSKPITGVVRDGVTGKPVADVWLNGSARGPRWWENYVRAKTDKDGRYRLIGLPKADSYHVTAWGSQQDYIQAGRDIAGTTGLDPLELDFKLTHGVRVRGRITDKDSGKPVPAAIWYVPLEGNKYFAAMPDKDPFIFRGTGYRNEKDGSYSLLVLPGPGLILVRAEVADNPYMEVTMLEADRSHAYETEKYKGLGEGFVSVGGGLTPLGGHNAYRVLDPAADAKTATCDFHFERGRERKGKIMDPDGKPLSGVRVLGLSPIGKPKTLGGSSFTAVSLHPRQARTLAFAHKERKLVGYVRLAGESKEAVTVQMLPAAALTGRLLDADGKPLAGVEISAYHRDNGASAMRTEIAGRPAKTGADGKFHLDYFFPDLDCGIAFRKGGDFYDIGEKYGKLTLKSGTNDLGDIRVKRR